MSIKSMLEHLKQGYMLNNAVLVKKIAIMVNLIGGLLIAASQAGLIHIDQDNVMNAMSNANNLIENASLVFMAAFNAWSHVATTDKVGFSRKPSE